MIKLNVSLIREQIYKKYDFNSKSRELLTQELHLPKGRISVYIHTWEKGVMPALDTIYPILKAINLSVDDVIIEC
jgi:hypothetical protein